VKETIRQFKDGEIIFREGDESLAMFVVQKGRVKLIKTGSNGNMTLATLAKGEMFGEMGILDGIPRNATAVAVGAVITQVMPRHDFLERLQADPKLALQVMTKLVERLRTADELLVKHAPPVVKNSETPTSSQKPSTETSSSVSTKPGLLGRLFKRGKTEGKEPNVTPRQGPLRIFVAGFGPDVPPETVVVVDAMVIALEQIPSAIVRRLDDYVAWPDDIVDPETARQKAGRNALSILTSKGADVLIWGRVETIGHLLEVHATAAATAHELRLGRIPTAAAVYIPLEDMADPIPALLRSLVLGTFLAETGRRSPEMSACLSTDVMLVGGNLTQLISGFAATEQASTKLVWANSAALCLANDNAPPEMWDQVSQTFEDAARRLPRTARDDWADVYIGLGLLEFARAERNIQQSKETDTPWDTVVEILGLALESVHMDQRPWEWALLNERLGAACYRQGSVSGDDEHFKSALAHYQAATQIYTRADHTQKWAELVSSLAQVLQVYGDLLGSIPALERAVELCRATLEVRSEEKMPLLWAASQNNLGSALFLLAKRSDQSSDYLESSEAFRKALTVYQVNGQARLAAITEKNLERVETANHGRSRRNQRLVQPAWDERSNEAEQ